MDPVSIIAGAAAAVKGIIGALPKGGKRMKLAGLMLEREEESLKLLANEFVAAAERGETMPPSALRMAAHSLARSAGAIDGIGDILEGEDDQPKGG